MDLYITFCHCPNILTFLLPSDVCRISSMSVAFREFCLGKSLQTLDENFGAIVENVVVANYNKCKENIQNSDEEDAKPSPSKTIGSSVSDLGEIWWRKRCINNIALPVIGVVKPLNCWSWQGTYATLRNLYPCQIAIRLTRDLSSAHLHERRRSQHDNNKENKSKQHNNNVTPSLSSPSEPNCYEKWITLHDEELEEAGLERFFQQSDFFKFRESTI